MCVTIEDKVIKYIKDYDNFINKVAYNISKKCVKLEFEDVKQQMLLTLIDNCKKYEIKFETSIISMRYILFANWYVR